MASSSNFWEFAAFSLSAYSLTGGIGPQLNHNQNYDHDTHHRRHGIKKGIQLGPSSFFLSLMNPRRETDRFPLPHREESASVPAVKLGDKTCTAFDHDEKPLLRIRKIMKRASGSGLFALRAISYFAAICWEAFDNLRLGTLSSILFLFFRYMIGPSLLTYLASHRRALRAKPGPIQ